MKDAGAGSTPPRRGLRFQAAFNGLVAWLLRSPLHRVVSAHLLLLRFTGRRSRAPYTVSISYLQQGSVVIVFAGRDIVWWKNLQGGAPVVLRLRGRNVPGSAMVVTDDRQVVQDGLEAFLRHNGPARRFYEVPFNVAGQPDRAALARAADRHVMVQIQLSPAAN